MRGCPILSAPFAERVREHDEGRAGPHLSGNPSDQSDDLKATARYRGALWVRVPCRKSQSNQCGLHRLRRTQSGGRRGFNPRMKPPESADLVGMGFNLSIYPLRGCRAESETCSEAPRIASRTLAPAAPDGFQLRPPSTREELPSGRSTARNRRLPLQGARSAPRRFLVIPELIPGQSPFPGTHPWNSNSAPSESGICRNLSREPAKLNDFTDVVRLRARGDEMSSHDFRINIRMCSTRAHCYCGSDRHLK